MRRFDYVTLDVFTDRRFAGNQLAVVFGADGLTTEEMLTITREFNYAETTFVLAAESSGNTARVRIFTIGYEMPFAGHPTVGTAIALAKRLSAAGDLRLELNTGVFPVRVEIDGGNSFAEFENPNLPAETGSAPDASLIEAALSLPKGSADRQSHRPRLVGAGVNYVFARAPLDVVRRARLSIPDFEALELKNTVGVLLYAEGGEAVDATYHVRMFAPGAGVSEDAATGSAAAALPGQIALSEQLNDGAHRWVIEQGFEMGRPSRIYASLDARSGKIERVRIGGNAAAVMSGVLQF